MMWNTCPPEKSLPKGTTLTGPFISHTTLLYNMRFLDTRKSRLADPVGRIDINETDNIVKLLESFQIINFQMSYVAGGFIVLIFAYTTRFLAVGNAAIRSGVLKIHPNAMDASTTMGTSFFNSIRKIIMPLIFTNIPIFMKIKVAPSGLVMTVVC